jgi:hypothetical protein
MPAFRGVNLRSGDLAEQLGLFLLQSLALVAPVPRTEDIGIDAVVTLLTRFDSKRFIAEDSFLVQIKSCSQNKIRYEAEQVNWLKGLKLPLFIAIVNKNSFSVRLFSTHSLTDAFVTNPELKILEMDVDGIYESDLGSVDESSVLPIGR